MQAQDRTDRLAANFEARLDRIDAEIDLERDLGYDPTVSEEENHRRFRDIEERIRELRAEIARELDAG